VEECNDTGGIAGSSEVNGFLPNNKGYYHGGDLTRQRAKLDQLPPRRKVVLTSAFCFRLGQE
jgi:hypothetical protein